MSKVSAAYAMDNEDPVRELNDSIKALETDIRDHRNKAVVFRYFAAHLFDEDYTLLENDLRRLEIVK